MSAVWPPVCSLNYLGGGGGGGGRLKRRRWSHSYAHTTAYMIFTDNS